MIPIISRRILYCITLFWLEDYSNAQLAVAPNLCLYPGRYFVRAPPSTQFFPQAMPAIVPLVPPAAPIATGPVIRPAAVPVISYARSSMLPSTPLFNNPVPSFVPAAAFPVFSSAQTAAIHTSAPSMPLAVLPPAFPIPRPIVSPVLRATQITPSIPCFPISCRKRREGSKNFQSLVKKL